MKAKTPIEITTGSLPKNMLRYAIPLMLSGILQLLFNTADTVVVGRFTGSTALAAVGSTNALVNLITNLFIGLSSGATVAVSHAFGAKDDARISRTVHTAIATSLVAGVLVCLIGVVGCHTFLGWMGSPHDVIDLSTLYLRIFFLGMPGLMLYNFGSGILRAVGDTKRPFYYLTIAGVVNVILNLFFVLVLHMGVAGVATATAISQTLSAVLVLRCLLRETGSLRLDLRQLRFHRQELGEIVRIGIPAGLQGSMFSLSNVLIQSSINSFGSEIMSGTSAAQNLTNFVWIAMNAFHHTCLTFIGQCVGAKKNRRITRALGCGLLLVMASGAILGAAEIIFARPLLHIFITDSATAIEYGIVHLTIICSLYFLCGTMDTLTGALRGLGSSLAPMLSTLITVCVFRILWVTTVFRYAFANFETMRAYAVLFLSYPLTFIVNSAVQLLMFFLLKRKKYPNEPLA